MTALDEENLRNDYLKKDTGWLSDKADDLFSIHIRKKFADYSGKVKCSTCPRYLHWKEITCGHYMPRRHNATRFEIKNAGPQCGECNGPRQGESLKLGLWLNNIYGAGTSEQMLLLAHKNFKLDKFFLIDKIIELKNEPTRY